MSATRIRLNPAQRREQLLDLGVKLLSVKRLEDLSIDALAEVAGISRGLLYHYFSNKRDFHLAVLRRMADDIFQITAPTGEGDPLTQLARSLEGYLDFVAANREAYVSFIRAAAAGDEEYYRIYEDAKSALTDRIFDSAGPDVLSDLGLADTPATRLLAKGWSAMVEEIVLNWLTDDRGISREELLDTLARVLVATGASTVVSH